MPSFTRHADVDWTGPLAEGHGTASAGTAAFSLPVTFPSRINEHGDGRTTPEELLAASHAVCYAMVLAHTIGQKGGSAAQIHVTATVTAELGDAGIRVASSALRARVEGLQGIDTTTFQAFAEAAEKGCPISNALRGSLAITVEASAS